MNMVGHNHKTPYRPPMHLITLHKTFYYLIGNKRIGKYFPSLICCHCYEEYRRMIIQQQRFGMFQVFSPRQFHRASRRRGAATPPYIKTKCDFESNPRILIILIFEKRPYFQCRSPIPFNSSIPDHDVAKYQLYHARSELERRGFVCHALSFLLCMR